MISLKNYFIFENKNMPYRLPVSLWSKMKLQIIFIFLQNLPFFDNLFLDTSEKNFVNNLLRKYVKENFQADFFSRSLYFRGHYIFEASNVIRNVENFNLYGHGSSFENGEISDSKALGEFLERYYTSIHGEKIKYVQKSYQDLSAGAVLPFHFHFRGQTITENKIFDSILVEDLPRKKKVFYPRQNIFWRQADVWKKEGQILDITTSGCAGGFTIEQATVAAIFELVERDSFICYWLTKSVPDIVDIPSGKIQIYDKVKKILNNLGCNLLILNTTTDIGIPSVVAVAIDTNTNGVVVSGGSGETFNKAIISAVSEIASCVTLFDSDKDYILENNYKPFSDHHLRRTERLLLWKSGKYFEHFNFFISGRRVEYQELENVKIKGEVEELVKHFKFLQNGYENIYRYVVNEVKLEFLGYFVVRVVIPKLYPLYLGENMAILDSERLIDFRKFKNISEKAELNIYPHPFP